MTCQTINQTCCSYITVESFTTIYGPFSSVTTEGTCCDETECDRWRHYLKKWKCWYNTRKPDKVYNNVPPPSDEEISALVFSIVFAIAIIAVLRGET